MIPDWRAAVDNALRMLRPGGLLGAVDFYAAPHDRRDGLVLRKGLMCRFWRRWFGHDGVHLDPQHLPYLLQRTDPICCEQHRAPVAYLAGLRAPYYLYIGRKPAA